MAKTIQLEEPIACKDGKTLTTLDVKPLKVRSVAVYETAIKEGKSETEASVAMIAHAFKLDPEDVWEFSVNDMDQIGEIIKPFKKAPAADTGVTGAPSSPTAPAT